MAKNKYEVIKDAGVGFEVGKIIESDNLHPSLLQHVRQVSVGAVKDEGESEKKPAGKAKAEPKPKPEAKPAETPPPPGPPDDNT